jgi:hypothetical protein
MTGVQICAATPIGPLLAKAAHSLLAAERIIIEE